MKLYVYRNPLALIFTFVLFLSFAPAATAQQPGFGIEYTSLFQPGDIVDMETVESEDFVCMVARTRADAANPSEILIRLLEKSTGNTFYRQISIAFSEVAFPSLSVTLAHDQRTAIIATNFRGVEQDQILGLTFRFSDRSILFQRQYVPLPQTTSGVQLKKRFTSTGGANGFTLAFTGRRNGAQRITAIELNPNLTVVSSRLLVSNNAIDFNQATSSDSNDELMIISLDKPADDEIVVLRYNTNSNNFDWVRKFNSIGANTYENISIAYNINTSTTNRRGFFVTASRIPAGSGSLFSRPLVFRARNGGVIAWSTLLQSGSRPIDIVGAENIAKVLISPNFQQVPGALHQKYGLDQSNGNIINSRSHALGADNRFTMFDLADGFENQSIVTGGEIAQSSNWMVYRLDPGSLFIPEDFTCPVDATFSQTETSVFVVTPNLPETGNAGLSNQVTNFQINTVTSFDSDCFPNKQEDAIDLDLTASFEATLYPNPLPTSASNFYFDLESSEEMQAEIVVMNSLGQIVHTQAARIQKGNDRIVVQPAQLPAGIYLVELRTADRSLYKGKLVRQ